MDVPLCLWAPRPRCVDAVRLTSSFFSPVFTEMYQLYRLPVRGWFEAVYFTRRTCFVVLLLYLGGRDLIWRAVAGCVIVMSVAPLCLSCDALLTLLPVLILVLFFVCSFVCLVAFLFWTLAWRPYARKSDNYLAAGLMGSGVVIAGLEIYATLAFLNDESNPEDTSRQTFLDVMYVALFCWPLLYMVRFQLVAVQASVRAACEARRSKKTAEWRVRHASVVLTNDRAADGAQAVDIQDWVDANVTQHGTLVGDAVATPQEADAKESMQSLSHELMCVGVCVFSSAV